MSNETNKLFSNRPVQEKTWIVERVGWAAMAVVILAALLGAFSKGPISWAQVTSSDGRLVVEYERFLRHQAPSQLKLSILPRASSGVIHLPARFLTALDVQRIHPDPIREVATPDGIEMEFALQPGERRTEVLVDVRPSALWLLSGTVRLGQDSAVHVSSFIYP